MDLVLDCSVICGFLFANQRTSYTLQVADALKTRQGFVPPLFIAEISNVLRTQERRGHLSPVAAAQLLHGVADLSLTVADAPTLAQSQMLLTLAREHTLSAYDATYLTLAHQFALPLATQDKALAAAAQTCDRFFTGND